MTYNNRFHALLLVMLTMGIYTFMVGMEQKEVASSYRQFVENIAIGSAAGAAEVIAQGQSLTAAKTILQRIEGKSVQDKFGQFFKIVREDPRILYRGFGVNMGCMIPATAAQIATDKSLEELMPGKDFTTVLLRTYVAGAFSAGFISPTEMVALHQQISKKNAYHTFKQLTANKGIVESIVTMYRGFGPKMYRDGPFGVALLACYPWAKEKAKKWTNDDRLAIVGAGGTVGGGVAIATHPFDRISTFMQVDYKKERAKTMWDVFKIIYGQKGIGGFYAGIVPRLIRCGGAVPIIYTAQDMLRNKLHKKTT